MKLLAIAEHFPSPYKPYHQTQFERFLVDGHELDIYAFEQHEGGTGGAGDVGGLAGRTRYLPATLRDLPGYFWHALRQFCGNPLSAAVRALRAFGYRASFKERVLNLARALLLPAHAPDVCIVHNLRAATHLRFLKAIYPDAVISMYYHGGELPGVPVAPDAAIRETFGTFDVVFTNTQSSRRHAIGRGQSPQRIVTSPVGFDLRSFPDPFDRRYRADGRLNLLMAGRMSEEKGFLLGLRAVQALLDEGIRDVLLRIVGDGPQRQLLADFVARHGLERHVELLGRVDQAELKQQYRQADVFLLPSIPLGTWEENQACVVQEALMLRAVAAVSRTGGVCESTAPSMLPYSFAIGSVAGIVASLRALSQLSADELRALGAQGRAFVENRYDIRTLNRELLDTALAYGRGDNAGRAGEHL